MTFKVASPDDESRGLNTTYWDKYIANDHYEFSFYFDAVKYLLAKHNV